MLNRHGENSRMWRHCSMAAPAVGPGFEDERLEAALEQVRRRGEADGPGSDDSYGKVGGYIHGFLCFIRWGGRFIAGVCRSLWDRQAADGAQQQSRSLSQQSWLVSVQVESVQQSVSIQLTSSLPRGQEWVGSSTRAVAMLSASSSAAR